MLDYDMLVPPGYAERSCLLVKYRLPWLPHCFVLCCEACGECGQQAPAELMAFFLSEAVELARASVGDPQAFMLIHSGSSVRKRENWHLHVFVVRHRWQKAWVYRILGAKNFALALWSAAHLGGRKVTANPPADPTSTSGLSPPEAAAHIER